MTIVIFVIVLGLIVFVHELGHFLSARKLGIRVDEFGFGFPPRMFGIQRGTTLYSLNWVPLGGFVKIKGESGESSGDADSFASKKPWQKIAVLGAGVAMNLIFAYLLFSIGLMMGIPQEVSDADITSKNVRSVQVLIIDVDESSPADKAGITRGDRLVRIDETEITSAEQVTEYIRNHAEREIDIGIRRGANEMTISVRPAVYGTHERALAGIAVIRTGLVRYGFFESFIQAFSITSTTTLLVLFALGQLVYGLFTGAGISDQISGPVGVAVATGQVAQLGIAYLINFTAVLSINLAILNALPIPALDGGRIVFALFEKFKGRPVNPKLEGTFHHIGFVLLIALVVVVTYRDIAKYGQHIWSGIVNIIR